MKGTKGFRVPAQGSKKDQLKQLDTELKNMQMAGRISQMMVQQLMQNVKSMGDDLGNALNQLMELQYKYTAVQKHLNLDTAALDKIANEQRLKDFEEGSKKADESEGLEVADEVEQDSTITITSTAVDEQGQDRGIFRSRLKLAESGVPDLIQGLQGKKVGGRLTVKLNGLEHHVEILAIRKPAAKVEETAAQEVTH